MIFVSCLLMCLAWPNLLFSGKTKLQWVVISMQSSVVRVGICLVSITHPAHWVGNSRDCPPATAQKCSPLPFHTESNTVDQTLLERIVATRGCDWVWNILPTLEQRHKDAAHIWEQDLGLDQLQQDTGSLGIVVSRLVSPPLHTSVTQCGAALDGGGCQTQAHHVRPDTLIRSLRFIENFVKIRS